MLGTTLARLGLLLLGMFFLADLLESSGWLDRVRYHLWRAAHHLLGGSS